MSSLKLWISNQLKQKSDWHTSNETQPQSQCRTHIQDRPQEKEIRSPEWIQKQLQDGVLSFRSGKLIDAETHFRAAVTEQVHLYGLSNQNTVHGQFWLIRALYQQGKYHEAGNQLRGMKSWWNPVKTKSTADMHKLRAKYALARIFYMDDRHEEAEKVLRALKKRYGEVDAKVKINLIAVKHWLTCGFNDSHMANIFQSGESASIAQLSRNASTCSYCRTLLHSILVFYHGLVDNSERISVEIWKVHTANNDQPYVEIRVKGLGDNDLGIDKIEIRMDTDDEFSWKVDPRGTFPQSLWSSMSMKLRCCVKDHKICQVPNPEFRPRRLLYIEHPSSKLRLLESATSSERPSHYCALSYCWGTAKDTLTTTKENLLNHLTGISFDSLPQTIQDAVVMCRELGIAYLWVDALCIVQNDHDQQDWYEQSSEMCEIYSNAHIVLSIDAAPSSDFGFLPGRDHNQKQWQVINVKESTFGHKVTASVRAHKLHSSITYDGGTWDGSLINPLSGRGWALQESTLANRLIRVTTNGLIWECNHKHQSGMGYMSQCIRLAKLIRLNPSLEASVARNELKELYGKEEPNTRHIIDFMDERRPDAIHHAWHEIVTQYSERDLTRDTDKLPALSGLARFVAQALDAGPDEYLAGHWRGDLPSSLLWYVGPTDRTATGCIYRAPSWSWASIDGPIRYFREQYQFKFKSWIEIDGASCQPSSVDHFGRVTAGEIQITGQTVQVHLKSSQQPSYPLYYLNSAGSASRAHPMQFSWVSVEPFDDNQLSSVYEVLLDKEVEPNQDLGRKCKCLFICEHCDTLTGGRRVWWLVLQEVPARSDRWERIGIGYFNEYGATDCESLSEHLEAFETITLV